MISPASPTPFIFGSLRPTVVISDQCETWEREELRTVFLHELAHLCGRDTQFLFLGTLVKALHWPNPLVWISIRFWKETAELAADEAVVRAGISPTDYAETLCRFASRSAHQNFSLGLTMADSSTEMEQRIGRLLLLKKNKPTSTTMTKITTIIIASGTFVIGGLAFSEEKIQPKQEISPAANERRSLITQKLQKTIIPEVHFENITVAEAIDFLSIRSKELDTSTKKASSKGLKFVIQKSTNGTNREDPGLAIIDSLYLSNATLDVIIQHICNKAELRYKVDEFAVTIFSQEDFGNSVVTERYRVGEGALKAVLKANNFKNLRDMFLANGVEMPEGSQVTYLPGSKTLFHRNTPANLELSEAIMEALIGDRLERITLSNKQVGRLENIMVPVIDFKDITLKDALDYLGGHKGMNGQGPRKGPKIHFTISGKPDPGERKIDQLSLKNVPAFVVLRYICDSTQTTANYQKGFIRISPKPIARKR